MPAFGPVSSLVTFSPFKPAEIGDDRACIFGISLKRGHVVMAVHHPGKGRMDRCHGVEVRFHFSQPGLTDHGQIGNTIGLTLGHDGAEALNLIIIGGDNQLANAVGRHPAFGAIRIHGMRTLNAEPCL